MLNVKKLLTRVTLFLDALNSNSPKVVLKKEISESTSAATVTLETRHLYLVIGGHPFQSGCAYVISGWSSGAARITPILANSHLSLSIDTLTLTISLSTNTLWIRVLDLGADS